MYFSRTCFPQDLWEYNFDPVCSENISIGLSLKILLLPAEADDQERVSDDGLIRPQGSDFALLDGKGNSESECAFATSYTPPANQIDDNFSSGSRGRSMAGPSPPRVKVPQWLSVGGGGSFTEWVRRLLGFARAGVQTRYQSLHRTSATGLLDL